MTSPRSLVSPNSIPSVRTASPRTIRESSNLRPEENRFAGSPRSSKGSMPQFEENEDLDSPEVEYNRPEGIDYNWMLSYIKNLLQQLKTAYEQNILLFEELSRISEENSQLRR